MVFKRKLLSSSVALAIAGYAAPLMAEEEMGAQNATMEEVVVKGIRGSLQRSMDIKRDASGVVDAISAEEMGKFPDANLAESLQRITGVSISRSRGRRQPGHCSRLWSRIQLGYLKWSPNANPQRRESIL